MQEFFAVFEQEEDGGFSVSVPALPGCFSQGDSFEEAVQNITEAIELYLETKRDLEPDWQPEIRPVFSLPVRNPVHV